MPAESGVGSVLFGDMAVVAAAAGLRRVAASASTSGEHRPTRTWSA